MSSFTGNIKLEQIGKTDNCKVLADYSFYSKRFSLKITVKEGFITDLGSIPTLLQSVVRGSKTRFWRAFVIHDAMYRKGYDRETSDKVLDEALIVLDCPWWTRCKIYYPLRVFGSATTDEVLIANASRCVEIEKFEYILAVR